MATRQIVVTPAAPEAFDAERELLARNFDDAYAMDERGRVVFNSIGGPIPAFDVSVVNTSVRIELENVDRDYGAGATVAESIARRCGGRAVDQTTREVLWPLLNDGEPVKTVELCWWVDARLGTQLADHYCEVASRRKREALPVSFSELEPYLCESAGNVSAFLELSHHKARAGGYVSWLPDVPLLGARAKWPEAAGGVAYLKLDLPAEVVDESWRDFFSELAIVAKARFAIARAAQPTTRRLGTWFSEGDSDLALPATEWHAFRDIAASWVWYPASTAATVRDAAKVATPEGALFVADAASQLRVSVKGA